MLLSLEDIRVHYGKVEAVKGVSLDVEESSIVTLIGSNGAGKTSILRAIFGLTNPSSGTIWFRGKRITGTSPDRTVRAGIAYVFEGRRVFPYLSVLANLKLGAFSRTNRREINRDLEEILEHFPILKERARQYAGTLSGGEQQMLAIGRALMASPSLLLLDEPSLGLAPMIVAEIGEIVKGLNESKGVAVLLVEQNARMALRLAHKGYVLETGKIVLEGNAQELLQDERVKRAYIGG
jgi:branched-chain amino acid transport system ATP-binding protein